MQRLMALEDLDFPGVEVAIPRTMAIASDVFEGFLERNGLTDMPHRCAGLTDAEILDAFRGGRFDRTVRGKRRHRGYRICWPVIQLPRRMVRADDVCDG